MGIFLCFLGNQDPLFCPFQEEKKRLRDIARQKEKERDEVDHALTTSGQITPGECASSVQVAA